MLSGGLTSLLHSEPDASRAAQRIANTPLMLAEAQDAYPAYHAAVKAPSGLDGVRRVIGSRFALFPQPQRDDAEFAAWWADYIDALEDVPEHALEAGMRVWIKRGGQFMPKPGELRELAMTTPSPKVDALNRLRQAMTFSTIPKGPVLQYRSREEIEAEAGKIAEGQRLNRERVLSMAQETMAALKPAERERPVRPAISAQVDPATGVSPELKALVARQRGEA